MNPLVLRVRNGRWWTTTSAYILSSVVGGACIGWLLGAIGAVLHEASVAPSWRIAAALLGACGLAGGLLDSGVFGIRLPTVRRQVDEQWRYRYRNWIYAIGYGFQLGLGFTTIVTTATVYATFVAMILVASQPIGLALGAWFGLTRSVSVLAVAGVRNFGQFESIEMALARYYAPSRIATIAMEAFIGCALVALVTL